MTYDRRVALLGPKAGSERSAMIQFNPFSDRIDGFYGFVSSKSKTNGVLESLGVIKYNQKCLSTYVNREVYERKR